MAFGWVGVIWLGILVPGERYLLAAVVCFSLLSGFGGIEVK